MQSRFFINLALLVVVIALALIIFNSDNGSGKTNPLTSLSKQEVTQIVITHRERKVTIVKQGEHWQLTQPVNIAANDFRVNNLLDILSTPSDANYDATSLMLADYKLDTPETRIRFNDTEIAFGITSQVNNRRYVLLNNEVHLINDQFYPLISSQIGTLISQYLLPRDAAVTKLVLPEQTLTKTASGWQSSNTEIIPDKLVETIEHWKNSQAFGVHNYYARKSLGSIEVTVEDQSELIKFEVTDIDPWLIIARPELDLEYHFNLEFYDRLLRPGAVETLPVEFGDEFTKE